MRRIASAAVVIALSTVVPRALAQDDRTYPLEVRLLVSSQGEGLRHDVVELRGADLSRQFSAPQLLRASTLVFAGGGEAPVNQGDLAPYSFVGQWPVGEPRFVVARPQEAAAPLTWVVFAHVYFDPLGSGEPIARIDVLRLPADGGTAHVQKTPLSEAFGTVRTLSPRPDPQPPITSDISFDTIAHFEVNIRNDPDYRPTYAVLYGGKGEDTPAFSQLSSANELQRMAITGNAPWTITGEDSTVSAGDDYWLVLALTLERQGLTYLVHYYNCEFEIGDTSPCGLWFHTAPVLQSPPPLNYAITASNVEFDDGAQKVKLEIQADLTRLPRGWVVEEVVVFAARRVYEPTIESNETNILSANAAHLKAGTKTPAAGSFPGDKGPYWLHVRVEFSHKGSRWFAVFAASSNSPQPSPSDVKFTLRRLVRS